jgi:hypothetical protein
MQQMTAWGSDENGLEFTDRGKDRSRFSLPVALKDVKYTFDFSIIPPWFCFYCFSI